MGLELNAVASVPLEISKGTQRPLFDLICVPLGRVRCIPKSETFNSTTGFPPLWSEVLFVCVLRPILARGLPSRASGEFLVVSR